MRHSLLSFICSIVLILTLTSVIYALETGHFLEKEPGGVVIILSSEEWAKAEKARVILNISAASKDEDIVSIRGESLSSLKKISDTEWHVTSYHRSQDQAGLTRLEITAETRIAENLLKDIHEQVKRLSRAGMQIRISDIDFSPSLEDREKAKAEARKKIYRMALEEAERVSKELQESYRLWRVDFTDMSIPQPIYRAKMMAETMVEAGEPAPEIPRGDLLQIKATVILRKGN